MDAGGDVATNSSHRVIIGNCVAMINPISWAIFWAISRQHALQAETSSKHTADELMDNASGEDKKWDRMLVFQLGSGLLVAVAGAVGGTWPSDGVSSVQPSDWWYYLLTGGFLLPVCILLFSLAPVYISTAEMGCVKMLETVLAPLYAYWYEREEPTIATFIGGSMLIVAIVGHTVAQALSEPLNEGDKNAELHVQHSLDHSDVPTKLQLTDDKVTLTRCDIKLKAEVDI